MLLIILVSRPRPGALPFHRVSQGPTCSQGKPPPSCRAPGLREAPASCLHPGTGRTRGDPFLNPLTPLVWGKPGIEACPHWTNSYLSLKPSLLKPLLQEPSLLPILAPGHRSIPLVSPAAELCPCLSFLEEGFPEGQSGLG